VGNSLTDNTWYDPSGNVVKLNRAGSSLCQKTVYDGVNRATTRYQSYNTSETGYPYPISVTSDTVFQQTETTYDAASNVTQTVVRDRFHNATGTGPLTYPGSSQPQARAAYVALYPDALGRLVNSADYGTNGGATLSPPPSTAPARSDTILVTTTGYNERGEANQMTDPKGTVNQLTFDDAGRKTKLVENYISGGTGTDQNRESDYAYNADGKLATLTAQNSTTGEQVTSYTYGTTLSNSDVASNDLLASVTYPDGNSVTMYYNALGELKQLTDQLGTVHVYEYDTLGRLIHDCITALGSGVDGAVRRISRTYEVRGMLVNITSYDNPATTSGSVVNDVQHAYNTFSQLVTQYQSHSGAVNTSSTPSVGYQYDNGSANTIRLNSVTYPNARVLNYNYGSSGGTNDLLSRIASLIDNNGTTHLVDYTYVGLDRIVVADSSSEPNTELTYIKQGSEGTGDGGDQYTGWDRFSRVIDQRWIKTSDTTARERVKYGYDRASNRVWRDNLVADGLSANQDEYYTYDGLYQLATLKRGTLTGSPPSGISGTPTWEEDFTFDPTGNWSNYQNFINGTSNLNQARTHNTSNEIVMIAGSGTLISHDANGNTIKAPKPTDWTTAYNLTYDAWSRMVKVMSGTTTVATYAYDGLNRRVQKTTSSTRDYYYSAQWQILEERVGGASTYDRQFVWGLRHIDDLVLRDLNGGSPARLYALHDAMSVTAVEDTTATVQERFGYDGFGQPRFMTSGFGSRTSSSYGWEVLFDAYRWDQECGFYQVRNRYLHPEIGRAHV
jgi:YD repeat-containing protein